MTTTTTAPRPTTTAPVGLLASFGPNWFATVMGTGIVANAVATLPLQVPGLVLAARVVWVLAALLLVVVSAATAGHWVHHRERARRHLADPVMAHFYGAPAMALMTVGAGALLLGVPVVGHTAAVTLDAVLWSAGTLLGIGTAVVVPFQAFTRHENAPDSAFGGWLMPVVPPMVSAATGPLLLPHLPAGQPRLTLLVLCAALFGLTLVASLVVIGQVWSRLVHHGVGAAAAVPTFWIVLGPLGQSVTAAHTIALAAPGVLPAPYGAGLPVLALAFGLPMWGFALLWLALAAAITVRTLRAGLPFSMTWWSFTFPVGTLVTGTSGLADLTGATVLVVAAVALYAGLVVAWGVVAVRTIRGVLDRSLLS
ncbi:TDT family transporter [Nocardioides sp. KIGAM211]|uniref:TDT family transporter n=1 Tax=Nocardioides luti TaxID=2761101 RepID=A0A7X0VDL1_9ACTN|nr:TDT family transporter [Nocardioides luti]MBB6629443.1 TDT family transporter [Nocardioides luti]